MAMQHVPEENNIRYLQKSFGLPQSYNCKSVIQHQTLQDGTQNEETFALLSYTNRKEFLPLTFHSRISNLLVIK